jgi:hypothetical protein
MSDDISNPTDGVLGAGGGLGPRERTTYGELARLDVRIAALFLAGHQIVPRLAADAGAVYVLAHIGRELSRGVVRALLGEEASEPTAPDEELPETERNRQTIGRVLGLRAMHPLVTSWFQLNGTFSASCHLYVDTPTPAVSAVAQAFMALSDLLYGRVAPYFATAEELDVLIAVETPTAADVAKVEALLTRAQQRIYFFSRLQHAAWVPLLAERGHFERPPERDVHIDGSWRMRVWPEGEYLARVAAGDPPTVTEVLLRVPVTLTNAAVWAVVADAAMVVPKQYADRLARHVAKAMMAVPSEFIAVLLPHKAIDLAERLAISGDGAAWKLAAALLWTRGEQEAAANAATALPRWGDPTHAANNAFARVDQYELERFCEKVVPALERVDADRTLKLLVAWLERVIRFVNAAHPENNSEHHRSLWWRDVFDRHGRGSVLATLASEVARVAVGHAMRGREEAQRVWELLQNKSGGIFARLRLLVLAGAGPHLQEQLDAVIGGDALLDPPYGAREAASLLRAQFSNASPTAKALFRYALERGPDASAIRESVRLRWQYDESEAEDAAPLAEPEQATKAPPDSGAVDTAEVDEGSVGGQQGGSDRAPTKQEIELALLRWQAKRLRWFHDRLPPELTELARRAGVSGEVPTVDQQALDEVGIYVGGVSSWASPASPKSVDELAAMAPAGLVALLQTWRAPDQDRDSFAYRGLEEALTGYATAHVTGAVVTLALAASVPVRPAYLSALLAGVRGAAHADGELAWSSILGAAEAAVRAADRALETISEPSESRERAFDASAWTYVVRMAADVVQALCAHDHLPLESVSGVWGAVTTLIRSPAAWQHESAAFAEGLEGALMEALNSARGVAVRALLDAGLWEYRARTREVPPGAERDEHIAGIQTRMAPLLSSLLETDDGPARPAATMLGQFVPQLLLLAPEWFANAEEALFSGGAEDPDHHPAWGAYLLRARVYDNAFSRLRRWYVHAARAMPVAAAPVDVSDSAANQQREWTTGRALVSHVMVAVVRGLASLGDDDALVETTFARVPAVDRAHVCWQIYRDLSDADEAPPPELLERVLRFWEWRLTELEASPESRARDEEAEGLLWLFKTPHLPATEAVRLGRRALKISVPDHRTSTDAWQRLRELATDLPHEIFDLVEMFVEGELSKPFTYLPFDDVAPVLRLALASGVPDVVERATRLINRLGEKAGLHEYGRLLRGKEGGAGDSGPPHVA